MANDNGLPDDDQDTLACLLDNHGFAAVLRAVAQYARDCLEEEYSPHHPATAGWNHLHVIMANSIEAFVDHVLPPSQAVEAAR